MVTECLENGLSSGAAGIDWSEASGKIIPLIIALIVLYILSIISMTIYSQLMAVITQGFLSKLRCRMFDGMQNLPIGYFDTHKHGDIMSYYTNDIDTLRQLVSQSLPQLLQSIVIVAAVLGIMLWYSVWMTLIVAVGVAAMIFVSGKIGGSSAKYFIRQQRSIGSAEGYIQEMMNGQKVIKVFSHEKKAKEGFEEINDRLYHDSYKAHAYANALGPIIMNIGNILYVMSAMLGGIFILSKIPNISVSCIAAGTIGVLSVDILVPFLSMTKQFTGNVNQLSQQINSIVMGLAGAERIFSLMDEAPETDDGYVTLVNAKLGDNGEITETPEHTGTWAWKHPHGDGTVTYTLLRGDVRMTEVDFGYVPGKDVLHDVSVYAEPGQKIALSEPPEPERQQLQTS